jgi:hypothetical protein
MQFVMFLFLTFELGNILKKNLVNKNLTIQNQIRNSNLNLKGSNLVDIELKKKLKMFKIVMSFLCLKMAFLTQSARVSVFSYIKES